MGHELAKRAIVRVSLAFLVGDLFLTLLVFLQQPVEDVIVALLAGTLIGQFGFGCAAILRHEDLYEGAVGWLVLLVSASGLVPVVLNQADAAGHILLVALIIAGVSLATNLLPCVVFRWWNTKRGFQFSILHIMLLTTLVGIGIVVSSMIVLFVLAGIGFALLLLAPAAVGCFLIGLLSQKRSFLASMAFIVVFISAAWMLAPDFEWIAMFLLAQTITLALGGYVLMLVELAPAHSAASNSAATATQPRSELAPDPLDEP